MQAHEEYSNYLFIFFFKFSISITTISLLHFFISFVVRIRNVVLLLSIFLPLIGFLVDKVIFNPYSHPLQNYFGFRRIRYSSIVNGGNFDYPLFSVFELVDVCIILFLIILSITYFRNKAILYDR
jgi:hypothetical protein